MNLIDWINLPPDQFAEKLREAQMTRDRYDQLVASIEADERMEAEMRAAGTLPTKLPDGKLSDSLSYGVPETVEAANQAIQDHVFGAQSSRSNPEEESLIATVVKGLPKAISVRSRRSVGQIAFMIKHTPTRQRATKSPRPSLLRRIIRAAEVLDDLHAELHRDHPNVATDIRPEELARRRMRGRLIQAEVARADCGLSRDALGHVLTALIEHMKAIEELHPTERRRPPLPHGRVLRSVLFDAYSGSGLPAPGREEFSAHLQWLLELVGLEKASSEKLIDEMPEFKPHRKGPDRA